ncbi:MAG: IS66 family transposase [Caulobacteraceae bacterium]|nr:IS66 family transposase [Caulobacteraceae bacterium]
MHRIGEDVAEALDAAPARLRVLRTIRPKYACRACEGAVVQAPARRRLLDSGMATTALIANVVTWKFAWHVPLHRQVQMLDGQGVFLDRSTLALWVKRVAWWLSALYELQLAKIHAHDRVFCDETRLPVIEKGRRRAKVCQLWAHATDDRPWSGPAPPAVAYVFAQGRSHAEIAEQLKSYSGVLQVDGYGAYKALAKRRSGDHAVQLAFCMAHARRKFTDVHKKTRSKTAREVIELFGRIYMIEAEVRGSSAERRLAARQDRSAPLMAELRALLDETLAQISSKSVLAEAIKYTLAHWAGLNLFLQDGRIEVDNNTVERTMRPIALGRRNHMFAGSDGGARSWAILASLLQTAKLNGHDPFTWLNDALERIVSGEVKSHELEQLLAWNWRPPRPQAQDRLAA